MNDDFSIFPIIYFTLQKEKNQSLVNHFDKYRINEYDQLNFDAVTLRVNTVFVIENDGAEDMCPLCKQKMEKKPVSVRKGKKTRGFYFWGCKNCKRLFSTQIKECDEILAKSKVDYVLITKEESKDEKEWK